MCEFIFANLLIASSTKTHNSQSSDSRNQNLTYGITALGACCMYLHSIMPNSERGGRGEEAPRTGRTAQGGETQTGSASTEKFSYVHKN